MSETTHEFQLPTAGKAHEKLKPFEGTFASKVKMWMDPTQEPHESSGTMTNTWNLNGLYLNQDYVGNATEGPFPNFEGKGYLGYNTTEDRYEGFWIDTASTTMQIETGQINETGNVWEMHSEVKCPQTQQQMKKRSVITMIDDNHHKMECYFETPDGETKAMEIEYKRV